MKATLFTVPGGSSLYSPQHDIQEGGGCVKERRPCLMSADLKGVRDIPP